MEVTFIKKQTREHAFTGSPKASRAQKLKDNPDYELADSPPPSEKHIRQGESWVESEEKKAAASKEKKVPLAIQRAKEVIFRHQVEKEAITLGIIAETTISEEKYREWLSYCLQLWAWDGIAEFPIEPE